MSDVAPAARTQQGRLEARGPHRLSSPCLTWRALHRLSRAAWRREGCTGPSSPCPTWRALHRPSRPASTRAQLPVSDVARARAQLPVSDVARARAQQGRLEVRGLHWAQAPRVRRGALHRPSRPTSTRAQLPVSYLFAVPRLGREKHLPSLMKPGYSD
jgi:hypothetical protein